VLSVTCTRGVENEALFNAAMEDLASVQLRFKHQKLLESNKIACRYSGVFEFYDAPTDDLKFLQERTARFYDNFRIYAYDPSWAVKRGEKTQKYWDRETKKTAHLLSEVSSLTKEAGGKMVCDFMNAQRSAKKMLVKPKQEKTTGKLHRR